MIKLAVEPIEEPITYNEALDHLRIDPDGDGDYIPNLTYVPDLIVAAREHAESILNRCLITQSWDLFMDSFPDESEIRIPKAPLQSVTYLKYKNSAGTLVEWDSSNYIVDTDPDKPRIALAYGASWPAVYAEIQAVQIRFVAGYGGTENIKSSHRRMIFLILSMLYEHRGDDDFDFAKTDFAARCFAEDWIPSV